MRTYEELLAAQTELAHFNSHHDPSNGQFTSANGVSSRKAAKAEKKLAKQEGKLDLYRERAKAAYNQSLNALTYLNSDKKRERKAAGGWAARYYETRYYEMGEIYRQKAEKQLTKINKDGTRLLVSSLEPYSKVIGEAFIKRSIAGQAAWMFNPFESPSSSSKYKLNKEKAHEMAKEYEEYLERNKDE